MSPIYLFFLVISKSKFDKRKHITFSIKLVSNLTFKMTFWCLISFSKKKKRIVTLVFIVEEKINCFVLYTLYCIWKYIRNFSLNFSSTNKIYKIKLTTCEVTLLNRFYLPIKIKLSKQNKPSHLYPCFKPQPLTKRKYTVISHKKHMPQL